MSEHDYLVRHDSAYRNFIMLEELQAEMQPSIAQNVEYEPQEIEQPVRSISQSYKKEFKLYIEGEIFRQVKQHFDKLKSKRKKGTLL